MPAAKAAKKLVLSFEQDKETKGTRRFAEQAPDGERPTIGSIYVVKSALAELGDPTTVTVTVEAA
jgi:hypothetical protein